MLNTDRQSIFQTLVAVAVAGIVLVIIKLGAPIISPIVLAFFLAALGRPAFVYLEKRGFAKGWAMLGVILGMAAIGLILFGLAWLYVDRLTTGLAQYSGELQSRLQTGANAATIDSDVSQINLSASLGGTLTSALVTIVLGIADVIGMIIIAFVLAVMLLLEWPRFSRVVSGMGNSQPFVSKLPVMANTAVAYFTVRAKINLITGVVFALALVLVGIPYAPLWGIVTFFLSFIPYLGIIIAAAAPALLGLAESGWWVFWYVVIAVTVINLSVEYVVAPTMTGRRLSLSPTVVFISFFFWTFLLGSVGMLVSMPITVLLMLVFASEESTVWLANMLGSTGEPDSDESAVAATMATIDGPPVES